MIRSDKEILVLNDEAEEAIGRIWGLEDGALTVGFSRATVIRIHVGRIHRSITRDQYEKSRLEWLRALYRYWTANYDLAFAFTDATTDTTFFSTAFYHSEGHEPKEEPTARQPLKLSLAALGVVFGDIGIPPDQIIEVGVQMQL